MVKATSATQKQIDLVKLHEQSKKNLEGEIQNYKNEAQKQRKIIYQLEKERDCFINEASELKQKVGIAFCASGSFLSYTQNCEEDIFISSCASGRKLRSVIFTQFTNISSCQCMLATTVSGLSGGTSSTGVYSVRHLENSHVFLLFSDHLGNETRAGVQTKASDFYLSPTVETVICSWK